MRRKLAFILLCAMLLAMGGECVQATATSGVSVRAAPLVTQSSSTSGMIRVWLSSMSSVTTYNLTLTGTYTMAGQTLASGSQVKVEMSGGAVYVTQGGTRTAMGTSASLIRQSGGVRINESSAPSNTYPGNLGFFYSGGVAYVVCTLYIEDYVQGVLPTEMASSYPLEALKAQAILARTYAAANRKSGLYDVTDTSRSFRGVGSGSTRSTQAVNDTAGIVAQYNGSYIDPTYTVSNGGQTELNSNAWGRAKAGYLSMKDDPFDLQNGNSPTRTYMLYDTPTSGSSVPAYTMIREALASKRGGTASNYAIERIISVSLQTPKYASPSRVYTQMQVQVRFSGGVTDTVTIPVFQTVKTKLNLRLNSSDNELLTVTKETNGFRITARRSGNGVGMSQRGAERMANQGYDFKSILGFYFDNIQLTKMNFTTSWSDTTPGSTGGTSVLPTTAPTTERTGRVTLSNPNDRLNLRAQPNTTSAVVSRISNGATVTVTGESGDWYTVKYGSLTGYVSKQYITVTQTIPQTDTGSAYIQAESGAASLRSEARATADIVATLPNGAIVTVLQRSTSWSQVQYGTVKGYIMTQYLSTSGSTSTGTSTGTQTTNIAIVTLSNANDSLNLRQDPSTGSPILAKLRNGTTLTVAEQGSTWSKVSNGSTTGYVMNSYVRFQTSSTSVPSVSSTASPGTMTATTWPATVSLSSGTLNMRAMPNTSASIVANIPNRASVTVTQLGDSWCGITYGTQKGYAMRRYLIIDSSSGTSVTVTASPAPVGSSSAKAYVRTSGGNVNIRSSPSINGTVLGKAPNGAEIKVLDTDSQWTYGTYGGVTGYFSTAYLSFAGTGTATSAPTKSTGTSSGVTLYVKTASGGSLNLRETASLTGKVLLELPYGSQMTMVVDGLQWVKVSVGDVIGYVAAEYVTTVAPSTTATPQQTAQTIKVLNRGSVYLGSQVAVTNIRATAASSGTVLGTLMNSASVEVIGYSGTRAEWIQIRSGTLIGYALRGDFLLNYTVAYVTLAQDDAYLYTAPDASTVTTRKLGQGTIVTVLSNTNDGWANVMLSDGTTGYMRVVALVNV